MPINPTSNMPIYCKNCTHRFVCSIQENIREQEADAKKFNDDNRTMQQSISTTSYICQYKSIDATVNQ